VVVEPATPGVVSATVVGVTFGVAIFALLAGWRSSRVAATPATARLCEEIVTGWELEWVMTGSLA
jgi:hypothetical protein